MAWRGMAWHGVARCSIAWHIIAFAQVFMHGKMPTCGFFLVDEARMGNHLLTNVSVLDYLQAEGDLFMPLTGRANQNLTLSSFRRCTLAS